MTLKAVEYFERTRAQHGLNDFEGLAQSEAGVRLRHSVALSYFEKGQFLFDYGCGTGLILDSAAQVKKLPSKYVGYDRFEDLETYIQDRAMKHRLDNFQYTVLPESRALEEAGPVSGNDEAFAMCLGVTGMGDGSGGRHDYASVDGVLTLWAGLRKRHATGCISIPLAFAGQKLEADFHRFTGEEMRALRSAAGSRAVWVPISDVEIMLVWGF